MFFYILLLLFLYFFVIRPLFRVWSVVHDARRQAQQAQDNFMRAAGFDPDAIRGRRSRAANEPRRSKTGWSEPRPVKKKIDSSTGEYVKFTEVEVTATETSTETSGTSAQAGSAQGASAKGSSKTTYTATEEQITDIEWTDIP